MAMSSASNKIAEKPRASSADQRWALEPHPLDRPYDPELSHSLWRSRTVLDNRATPYPPPPPPPKGGFPKAPPWEGYTTPPPPPRRARDDRPTFVDEPLTQELEELLQAGEAEELTLTSRLESVRLLNETLRILRKAREETPIVILRRLVNKLVPGLESIERINLVEAAQLDEFYRGVYAGPPPSSN